MIEVFKVLVKTLVRILEKEHINQEQLLKQLNKQYPRKNNTYGNRVISKKQKINKI